MQPDLRLGCAQTAPPCRGVSISCSHPAATSAWGSCILILKKPQPSPFPFHNHCRAGCCVSVSGKTPQTLAEPKASAISHLYPFSSSSQWKPLHVIPPGGFLPRWNIAQLSNFVRFPSEMPNNLQTNPIHDTTRCAHFAFHGNMPWKVSG